MTINDYQNETHRTCKTPSLLQAALGLCGESGEVAEIVKKATFQGHRLNREHVAKELGDVMFYIAIAATAIGYDMEDIMELNVQKRRARYPDCFDPELSINRKPGDV